MAWKHKSQGGWIGRRVTSEKQGFIIQRATTARGQKQRVQRFNTINSWDALSAHITALICSQGEKRPQIKAPAVYLLSCQAALWTPSLNTQVHIHAHILILQGTSTQALQFCNSEPLHGFVWGNHREKKKKKKGSSSAKPWRQTERRPSDRYEEDGKVECTIRKRGRFLQSNSASKCFFAKKQSFIYLLLDPRALPRDDVMCIHTPGGLLTAQRLLSTWVSSSHTPPWLPEERKREKVSYRPCFSNIITLLCASENAHTHCPSANIKRRSSVTDDTSINRFTERKRKKNIVLLCLKCDSSIPLRMIHWLPLVVCSYRLLIRCLKEWSVWPCPSKLKQGGKGWRVVVGGGVSIVGPQAQERVYSGRREEARSIHIQTDTRLKSFTLS